MIYILCGFETCGKNEKYNKYCQYIKVCSLHTAGKENTKEKWRMEGMCTVLLLFLVYNN